MNLNGGRLFDKRHGAARIIQVIGGCPLHVGAQSRGGEVVQHLDVANGPFDSILYPRIADATAFDLYLMPGPEDAVLMRVVSREVLRQSHTAQTVEWMHIVRSGVSVTGARDLVPIDEHRIRTLTKQVARFDPFDDDLR